jgi:hypothetical protein
LIWFANVQSTWNKSEKPKTIAKNNINIKETFIKIKYIKINSSLPNKLYREWKDKPQIRRCLYHKDRCL